MILSNSNKIADVVFEGGGIKGIAFAGALKAMEKNGYAWKNIAGTSVGSIFASLLAVGYTGEELIDIIKEHNYKKSIISKVKKEFSIPNLGSLIFKNGVYSGEIITKIMERMFFEKIKKNENINNIEDINNKKKLTFGDLIIQGENRVLLNNSKYKRKYKLHIIAADVTRGKMLILPEDIDDYGIDPDKLEVSLAVRMSCSIPFYFKPVCLKNKDNEKCSIVDGGLLSNYPVWLFDVDGVPRYPTIGFRLTSSKKDSRKHKTNNLLNFGKAVIESMLEAQDDIHIKEMNYLRTIKLDCFDVKPTDFNISREKISMLIESGERCAEEFLKDWDRNYFKHVSMRKNSDLSKYA